MATARGTQNISNAQSFPSNVYPFNWDYSHKFMPRRVESRRPAKASSSQVYPFGWDYSYRPAGPPSTRSLPASFDGVEISSLVYPFAWNYEHASSKAAKHPAEDEPSLTPVLKSSFDGADGASMVYPFGWDYVHHQVNKKTAARSPASSKLPRSAQEGSSTVYPFRWDFTLKAAQNSAVNLDNLPPTPRDQFSAAYDGVDVKSLVYPFRWNYEHAPRAPIKSKSVKLGRHYPDLVVYSPVYPYNLEGIYPKMSGRRLDQTSNSGPTSLSARHSSHASSVTATSFYPFNLGHIYPAVDKAARPNDARLTHSRKIRSRTAFVNKSLEVGYPNIVVYSPVYPYNLDSLYPTFQLAPSTEQKEDSSALVSSYPFLCICSSSLLSVGLHGS